MIFGEPLSMADSVAKINAVTKDDIQRVANKIFSSKLTLSTLGAIEKAPSYEEITNALSSALV
jgi:predicted Zn-dependent peptidase